MIWNGYSRPSFPTPRSQLRPTNTSIIISGYVPRAEMVGSIVRIAEDYYPHVINRIDGRRRATSVAADQGHGSLAHQAPPLGRGLGDLNQNDFMIQSVSGLINATATQGGSLVGTGRDTVRFGIISDNNPFGAYIDALRRYDLIKVMAEPNLVAISGRPASFNSGGEFPIIVPQSLGTVSIQYREFGTRVDFVPIVLGNGSDPSGNSPHSERNRSFPQRDASTASTCLACVIAGSIRRWK